MLFQNLPLIIQRDKVDFSQMYLMILIFQMKQLLNMSNYNKMILLYHKVNNIYLLMQQIFHIKIQNEHTN